MSEVKNVRLTSLHPNPHRDMGNYPLMADKIDALTRSINDVGFWEGVIARPARSGYELAFGHHRVEAARLAGLKTVPVIVRDLDDEQMLQFMGRENGEDYKAEFLIMLNTWEAAVSYALPEEQRSPTEIARMLGWTMPNTGGRGGDRLSNVAQACSSAHDLISSGHLDRHDLDSLSLRDGRNLCQETARMIKAAEKNAAARGGDAAPAAAAASRAAKRVAQSVREGNVAPSEVRNRVRGDVLGGVEKPKDVPLFADFGHRVASKLSGSLFDDDIADKLEMIADNLGSIQQQDDVDTVEKIADALGRLSKRAAEWERRLRKRPKLRAIQGGK